MINLRFEFVLDGAGIEKTHQMFANIITEIYTLYVTPIKEHRFKTIKIYLQAQPWPHLFPKKDQLYILYFPCDFQSYLALEEGEKKQFIVANYRKALFLLEAKYGWDLTRFIHGLDLLENNNFQLKRLFNLSFNKERTYCIAVLAELSTEKFAFSLLLIDMDGNELDRKWILNTYKDSVRMYILLVSTFNWSNSSQFVLKTHNKIEIFGSVDNDQLKLSVKSLSPFKSYIIQTQWKGFVASHNFELFNK